MNYICESVCPKALSVEEVSVATVADSLLQAAIKCVSSGQWYRYKDCEGLSAYEKLADELSVTESGLLMRHHRIVIPTALRSSVINLAHEGHQGSVNI